MPYSNPIESKEFRQQLRKEATPCERILWHYLRGRQLEGLKFRQQHGYGPYVMDLYCADIGQLWRYLRKLGFTSKHRARGSKNRKYEPKGGGSY